MGRASGLLYRVGEVGVACSQGHASGLLMAPDCRAPCRLHSQPTTGVWDGGFVHSAFAHSPKSGRVHAATSLQELRRKARCKAPAGGFLGASETRLCFEEKNKKEI